jgi:hypothetical protein
VCVGVNNTLVVSLQTLDVSYKIIRDKTRGANVLHVEDSVFRGCVPASQTFRRNSALIFNDPEVREAPGTEHPVMRVLSSIVRTCAQEQSVDFPQMDTSFQFCYRTLLSQCEVRAVSPWQAVLRLIM